MTVTVSDWAGLNDGLFSETMDFRYFRLYYPLCVSRRVDTWHIVYQSYKDPCPKISVHGQHGQRWNLREFTASELQGSSARPSHFLDAETGEFPSLSMLPV